MTTLAERQAEFCSYFIPAYPMRSAAAIGGNATQENLCQPVTAGVKDHGSDGTLQWRLERLTGPDGLQPWCAAQQIPWDTLKSQALFTMHELEQPQYSALKGDLRLGLKSIETLTLNFCDAFERPSPAGRAADKRIAYAHDCLTILMRDAPAPAGKLPPPIVVSQIPSTTDPLGACQMPIELILQLVAPLAENLVSGLLKGVLTHVQTNGLPASPALPAAVHPASAPATGLTASDFAAIAKLIEDAIAKLQTGKTA
jgi:hypothetical protein